MTYAERSAAIGKPSFHSERRELGRVLSLGQGDRAMVGDLPDLRQKVAASSPQIAEHIFLAYLSELLRSALQGYRHPGVSWSCRMLEPFTFYSRMASAAFDMASTATRASEMLGASQEVIAKRSSMICAAGRSPLDGNYAELRKMVPEKIDAFSQAGAAMAGDWWAMQTTAITESQKLAKMAMSGRIPTLAEWSALAECNATFGLKSLERVVAASAKGLRPIHATAMANARRLRCGKR